jgi:hypothetical protein
MDEFDIEVKTIEQIHQSKKVSVLTCYRKLESHEANIPVLQRLL